MVPRRVTHVDDPQPSTSAAPQRTLLTPSAGGPSTHLLNPSRTVTHVLSLGVTHVVSCSAASFSRSPPLVKGLDNRSKGRFDELVAQH